MNRDNYSLEVLVTGRPVAAYHKDGRCFIEGRESTEYTLKFRNNSWKRVLAIFSVDGVEVIKGKAAAESENGYVVDAFSSIEVKGYRIDDANVAAFKFGGTQKSYSNLVGAATVNPVTKEVEYKKDTRNNGVIGVRVFEEKVKAHDYAEAYKQLPISTFSGGTISGGLNWTGSFTINGCSGALGPIGSSLLSSGMGTSAGLKNRIFYSCTSAQVGPSPSTGFAFSNVNQMGQLGVVDNSLIACSATAAPDFDLGTQWGTKLQDKVKEVAFVRAETSTDIEIYYASRESLTEFGIDFNRTKQIFAWPTAFEDKKQFCKVPEGYNA